MKSDEILKLFDSSPALEEFLTKATRATNEVGLSLGTSGTRYRMTEGKRRSVTLSAHLRADEPVIHVHTHPWIAAGDRDEPMEMSGADREMLERRGVAGQIILARSLSNDTWFGTCYSPDGNTTNFKIEFEGDINGPREERFVSSATVVPIN